MTRTRTLHLLAWYSVASRAEKCTPLSCLRGHSHRRERRLGNELFANDSDGNYHCHCQFTPDFGEFSVARLLTQELGLSVVCFLKMLVVMSLRRQCGRFDRLSGPIFAPLIRS